MHNRKKIRENMYGNICENDKGKAGEIIEELMLLTNTFVPDYQSQIFDKCIKYVENYKERFK